MLSDAERGVLKVALEKTSAWSRWSDPNARWQTQSQAADAQRQRSGDNDAAVINCAIAIQELRHAGELLRLALPIARDDP